MAEIELELPVLKVSEVIASLQKIEEEHGDIEVFASDYKRLQFEEVSAVVAFNVRLKGKIKQVCVLVPNGSFIRTLKTTRLK